MIVKRRDGENIGKMADREYTGLRLPHTTEKFNGALFSRKPGKAWAMFRLFRNRQRVRVIDYQVMTVVRRDDHQ